MPFFNLATLFELLIFSPSHRCRADIYTTCYAANRIYIQQNTHKILAFLCISSTVLHYSATRKSLFPYKLLLELYEITLKTIGESCPYLGRQRRWSLAELCRLFRMSVATVAAEAAECSAILGEFLSRPSNLTLRHARALKKSN